MRARPIGVPIFLVIGVVTWTAVTIAGVIAVLQAPDKNGELAIGLGLIWLVLIVFALIERWTGGRRAA